MSTGLLICVMVGNVAMWKPKLFEFAELHLSLPRLAPEEFDLLGVAELESKCARRTASPSFPRAQIVSDRLESQQAEHAECYAVRPGEPHYFGLTWKPPDRRHAGGPGTPQGGAPCGLRVLSWKLLPSQLGSDSDDLKFSPLQGGVEAATNSPVFSLQDSEQRLVAKVARQL